MASSAQNWSITAAGPESIPHLEGAPDRGGIVLRHRLLPKRGGLGSSGSAPLALDDVVDFEDLRLAGVDPDIGQQWHQALPERFPLLARIPYFADSEASVDEVGAVVVHASAGKSPLACNRRTLCPYFS